MSKNDQLDLAGAQAMQVIEAQARINVSEMVNGSTMLIRLENLSILSAVTGHSWPLACTIATALNLTFFYLTRT